MEVKPMVHASIKTNFKVTRNGKMDEIRCKHPGCKMGWAYPVEKDMTTGAVLAMLNHRASHDPKVRESLTDEEELRATARWMKSAASIRAARWGGPTRWKRT
jgi:hypothetical protein